MMDGNGWLTMGLKSDFPYVRLVKKGEGVMMSDTPMERNTNYHILDKANGDVLIFGLGIGLIILPLLRKENVKSITVVELYQDLIDVHLSTKINGEVLNMLNTKYIIFNGGPNGETVFQPNPSTCGNAWFVQNVQYVANADEEMNAMNANSLGDTTQVPNAWKAAQTAIVRNSFEKELNGVQNLTKDSSAFVQLDKYGLNEISYVSHNNQAGVAVFSDIYYDKGWKAYIDGRETPIIKANYILRALKLPAGDHKIEFRFRPETYYSTNNYAMISSILLYLLFGAALFMAFRKKENDDTLVARKESIK
jgi:hypothetical protein